MELGLGQRVFLETQSTLGKIPLIYQKREAGASQTVSD